MIKEVPTMSNVVSPEKIAAALTEHWSPRVVGELDDFVRQGRKSSGLADLATTTLHTGNELTDKTRSLAEQLRPVSG